MKAEIIALAQDRGAAPEVIDQLRAGGPAEAKMWAQANGLPSRLHPGRGHAEPREDEGQGRPAMQLDSGQREDALRRLAEARKDPAVPPAGGAERRAGVGAEGAPARDARPAAPDRPRPAWARDEQWVTDELIGQVQSLARNQHSHRDERNLLAGFPQDRRVAYGGTNETTRYVLDNGVVGYHKPFSGLNDDIAEGFGQDSAQQSVHEVVAWQLAKGLGEPWDQMVPPCVLREVEGRMGSFAQERQGLPFQSFSKSPEWESAAFFDALIGQQDRHPGNYLMAGDRLVLIDHGYCFATRGDRLNFSLLVGRRAKVSPVLHAHELDALDRLLDSPNLLGIADGLQPHRVAALRSRAETMRETGRIVDCF